MKYSLMVLAGLLILPSGLSAQPFRGPGPRHPERIEQLRKVRLIEVLDLSEEQSVRFFARMRDHEKERDNLFEEKMILLDRLDALVRSGDEPAMSAMFPDLSTLSAREVQLENSFFKGLSDILSPVQQAKFVLFERQFQKELRDALREMHRGRGE
jgi:hypothetical protein